VNSTLLPLGKCLPSSGKNVCTQMDKWHLNAKLYNFKMVDGKWFYVSERSS